MKTSIPVLIAMILVVGIIGFFVGRSFPAKLAVESTSTNTTTADKSNEKDKPAIVAPVVVDKKEDDNKEGDSTPEAKKPEPEKEDPAPEPKPEPRPSGTNTGSPNAGGNDIFNRTIVGISDNKISAVLDLVSENLEAKNLAYVSSLGQDCSGIYHQLKDSIQSRLPALAQGSEYIYPAYNTVRSSRQIANWYHEKGNLLIVEDAVKSKNAIRPGAVMFYGRSNERFSNMTIESLTDKSNNFTRNGQIMHIAVVTSVRKDEDGNVVDYTIMHGRNKRKTASRSGSKEVQSRNTQGLPAFGNWSQQWVAVANIATKN